MKRLMSLLAVSLFVLFCTGICNFAYAQEIPPNGDGKGTVGNPRNNEAWSRMIAEKYELSEKSATTTPPTGHWNIEATSSGVWITDDAGNSYQVVTGAGGAEIVTAANVITASECGRDFYLNSATEFQSTLPALSGVSLGCRMRFIVAAAPVGASYTIITGNSLENKIYGEAVVNGAAVAAAAEDTITLAASAALVGDWVEVRSDGTAWYVSGQGVGAGAITLTQAD